MHHKSNCRHVTKFIYVKVQFYLTEPNLLPTPRAQLQTSIHQYFFIEYLPFIYGASQIC